eukprot:m.475608 g.475608  ORF g.475608 m.475608 type:complete len:60 (+) comp21687_c1_seq40:1088-1267(+)
MITWQSIPCVRLVHLDRGSNTTVCADRRWFSVLLCSQPNSCPGADGSIVALIPCRTLHR